MVWIAAARPKTLAAAIAPVAVGTGLGAQSGVINWLPAAACLCGALLIQIGTNFANDAFDGLKGTDNGERIGPQRAVAAGLISPRAMLIATAVVLGLALVPGVYLATVAGWPIFLGGIVSLLCAVAYTGGPFPLAYHGLGDLFVLIFFGWFAVLGSAYVQSPDQWPMPAQWWLIASAIGLQAATIIAINNQRDHLGDAAAGKRTLAVRFGERRHRWYIGLLHAVATVCLGLACGWWSLPTLIAGVGGGLHTWFVVRHSGRALNPGLGLGALLEMATAVAIWLTLPLAVPA